MARGSFGRHLKGRERVRPSLRDQVENRLAATPNASSDRIERERFNSMLVFLVSPLGLIRGEEADGLAVDFGDSPEFSYINRSLAGFTLVHEGVSHA